MPVNEGPERAADGVDAEGVERIVILEEGLELGAGQERDAPASTPTQIAPVLSMKPQAGSRQPGRRRRRSRSRGPRRACG